MRGGEDVFSIGRSLLLPTGEVNLLRQIIRDTDRLIKTQERQHAILTIQVKATETETFSDSVNGALNSDGGEWRERRKSFVK